MPVHLPDDQIDAIAGVVLRVLCRTCDGDCIPGLEVILEVYAVTYDGVCVGGLAAIRSVFDGARLVQYALLDVPVAPVEAVVPHLVRQNHKIGPEVRHDLLRV